MKELRICSKPGCTRLAAPTTGMCGPHATNFIQRTTDGRRTGPRRKLTEADCAEIRRLNARLMSKLAIARQIGVDPKVIHDVLKGKYVPRSPDAA